MQGYQPTTLSTELPGLPHTNSYSFKYFAIYVSFVELGGEASV